MTPSQQALTIALVVLGTVLTRFLAFWIFPAHKRPPAFVSYLGQVLPTAVMGLLVVYAFRHLSPSQPQDSLLMIGAALTTAVCHLWKRNFLLSIALGTAVYMMGLHLLG